MGSDHESDHDAPTLSADTFAALQQFYTEQDKRDQEREEAAQNGAAAMAAEEIDFNKISFDEDWQLSQFWYDEVTAKKLAEECFRLAGEDGGVACISSPTLYIAIKKHFPQMKNGTTNIFLKKMFLTQFICSGFI